MFRTLLASAFLALATLPAAAKDPLLIHYGWSQPTLDQLKKYATQMEAEAPFDGLIFRLGVTDVMGKNTLKMNDDIKNQIKLYKQIKFKKYAHNFLMTMADQSKPDWLSKDYQKRLANNFALAAEVVAKAKMEGICFDPEGYGVYPVNSYWTSKYWLNLEAKPDWKGPKHTKEDYLAGARQAGRLVGEAMAAKNPKIKFFGLYLWSVGGDLMGEFCNGLIESLPKTAALIDGDEWMGYCATGENAYKNLQKRMKSGCGLLDKKLKAKYNSLGHSAIAFYLDFYCDPKSPIGITPKTAAKTFKDNLKHAKRTNPAFIWIYGEKGQWWDLTKYKDLGTNKFDLWETRIPGITAALFPTRPKSK